MASRPKPLFRYSTTLRFCELGAISPDYPYLDIAHPDACQWADRMHYQKTGDMVKAGIDLIRKLDGPSQQKTFAWLLGYTSHVVTDVTIHPVVELKVGEYQKNKGRHRICEMHQDAYIFQRLNIGEIGLAEHLDSGIWGCCAPWQRKARHGVAGTWQRMLEVCYADAYQTQPPVIDDWHGSFKFIVDKAEEGNALPLCPPCRGQYRLDLSGHRRSRSAISGGTRNAARRDAL